MPNNKKSFWTVKENNVLQKVFDQYMNGTLINLYELRSFIHEQYKYIENPTEQNENEQPDVAEFISRLLEKSNLLQNLTFTEVTTNLNRCKCYENEYEIQDQRQETNLKLNSPSNSNVYKLQE